MKLKLLNIIFLLFLCSCAVIPKDYTEIQTRDISNIKPNSSIKLVKDGWPDAKWWYNYNDPQLNNLINTALKNSPDLEVAEARFRSAFASVKQAQSTNKFNLSANAKYADEYFSKNGTYGMLFGGSWNEDYTLGLNARYQFDFWGQNRSVIKAAVGEARASMNDKAQAEQLLTASVAVSYFNLQTYWSRLQVLNQIKTVEIEILNNYDSLVKQGILSASDKISIETEVNNISQQVEALISLIDNEKTTLAALIGFSNDTYISSLTPKKLPEINNKMPSNISYDLLSRRADLQAARWRVEASISQVDASKSAFYPNISLTGFAGLDSIKISNLFKGASKQFLISPELTLPIFNSGNLQSQLFVSKTQKDLAVASYNQAIVNAIKDVYQSATTLNSLNKQYFIQAKNVILSNDFYKTNLNKFHQGIIDNSTLLQAQLSLLNQQDAIIQLQNQRLLSEISLIKALGGGYYVSTDSNKDR